MNYFLLQPLIVSGAHAIVSCMKPYITWLARDGLQECRECCGGFGYLKCNTIYLLYVILVFV